MDRSLVFVSVHLFKLFLKPLGFQVIDDSFLEFLLGVVFDLVLFVDPFFELLVVEGLPLLVVALESDSLQGKSPLKLFALELVVSKLRTGVVSWKLVIAESHVLLEERLVRASVDLF